MKNVKQVLVWRKDLNVRKGKLAAQLAHASLKAVVDLLEWEHTPAGYHLSLSLAEGEPLAEWLQGSFTKICVYVESEAELLDLYQKAQEAKIISALITDSGKTEFHGVPTHTCIAIGPDDAEKVDLITGHLKLL